MMNMRKLFTLYIYIVCCVVLHAQEKTVQNRPYCDLRPMHFGVIVGTHFQGMEFGNSGPVTFTDADGTETESLVTCEQDRWDMGFQVGVLGEMRLSEYFAARVAPVLYFGSRHVSFRDLRLSAQGDVEPFERIDLKTVYVACSMDLIYAAKRFNNHRPYVMAGFAPMLNLSAKSNDYVRMKSTEVFFEVGVGCDFYLPFFKLRPELKFMYSLSDRLNKDYKYDIKDKNQYKYVGSVNSACSSIVALSFYFE